MLRCLGSVPVRTGIRPARAEETCTCNVCSSPRAWERVGSAPVSWIGPRSSRHPTSLEAASWSWHGFVAVLPRVEDVTRSRFPAPSAHVSLSSIPVRRGPPPARSVRLRGVTRQRRREFHIKPPGPHRRLWRRPQRRTPRLARCPPCASRLDAQYLAGADRDAADGDVERSVRADCDRSGSGQTVDDRGSRSVRCDLKQPSG
jgi:hypothetical protein